MNRARPPRWSRWLVELVVSGPHREYVLGDLEEMYARRRAVRGPGAACAAYLGWGMASGLGDVFRRAVSGLVEDLRSVLRQMRARKRFHLGAVIVLALGLGMLTATWGIDYGAYGRGLPVAAPERMVAVSAVDPAEGEVHEHFSVADAQRLRAEGSVFDGIALWSTSRVVLNDPDHAPEQIFALHATSDLAGLLEVEPYRGRALRSDDALPGAPAVVLLGYDLWRRRFAADPAILGGTVEIDGTPTTVIGVLPPGPAFQGEELWVPIQVGGEARYERAHFILARTRPRTTIRTAQAAVSGLGAHLDPSGARASPLRLRLLPFAESFREPGGVGARHAWVVTRAGWLLFLMALASVANLFLIRTRRRERELAVRRALGGGRTRILRHLVLEVVAMVALAVACGAAVAAGVLDWYQRNRNATYAVPISWQQWAFGPAHLRVIGVAGACAVLVVAAVVAAAAGSAAGPTLRRGRGTTTALPLAHALVALEIAGGGALFLLAALMLDSTAHLRRNDWGFAVGSVLTAHVALPAADAVSGEARLTIWSELEGELRRLPGVEAVGLGTQLPLVRYAGLWGATRAVEVEGTEPTGSGDPPRRYVDAISPSYFDAFEAPLVAGRAFTSADDRGSEPVAMVNAAFAGHVFADGTGVGRRIRVWDRGTPGPWRTVIGVAGNLWMDADENADPDGVYVPIAQAAPPEISLAVRVRGDPSEYAGSVRRLVASLLPGVPITDLWTMPELIRYQTRVYAREGPLFIWLGVAALLLAVVGLYLVVSYLAAIRMAEFGIRATLGASRMRLVGRAALWSVPALAAGVPAGIATGLWLTRGFARFMFEVDPWSPWVVATGFGVLVAVCVGASLLPALRAARVDLVQVMRAE